MIAQPFENVRDVRLCVFSSEVTYIFFDESKVDDWAIRADVVSWLIRSCGAYRRF